MRMFQSSSRHSSEQSTAHNSSRPTASQLKGVSDTLLSVQSKLESNGLQSHVSERIFQLLQYSRQHPSFSAHWADLMTKAESTFPAFSFRIIVDFAVQFLFRCKFSFHEKRRSSQVWQWRDLPQPITILCQRIATNGIASFCIDHRWRQMAFFRVCQNGEGPTFARLTWNKAAFMQTKFISLLYKTNRFHVAVHLSSNRSQRTSKCGKNISDTLGYCLVCHLFVLTTFWRHLWSITGQMHGNMESIC